MLSKLIGERRSSGHSHWDTSCAGPCPASLWHWHKDTASSSCARTRPQTASSTCDARFRNHTLKFFKQHGITNVLYGKPLDAPLSQNTMLYLLAFRTGRPRRRAGTRSARTRDGRR